MCMTRRRYLFNEVTCTDIDNYMFRIREDPGDVEGCCQGHQDGIIYEMYGNAYGNNVGDGRYGRGWLGTV